MSDIVDMLSPEEALKTGSSCVCLVLDEPMIKSLYRLQDELGVPVALLVSESLRNLVNTFMPLADLNEQGKFTIDSLSEISNGLKSLIIKTDVAKARVDKGIKKVQKENKLAMRGNR